MGRGPTTPTGRRYAALEAEFLNRVPPGMTPAAFDLEVWKRYAKTNDGARANQEGPAAGPR